MPIKKIVVAYHEAGHAVVARRFGVAVNRIATGITGGGPFGGRWFTGSTVLDPAAESRASLRQRLWIALAGAAAQNRYDPHDPHTHRRGRCASDDYERARKLYAELHRKPDCNDEDLLG